MQEHSRSSSHRFLCLGVALLLAVFQFMLKAPLLTADWILLDDPNYVLAPAEVRGGLALSNLWWALTTSYYGNWMPLTWLSYQLDASIWGLHPFGFHLSNLLLDYLCALLFFFFLLRASGHPAASAVCALLFLIHPLHVEPAAWVSSRKDVLAGVMWMSTLLVYHSYLQARSSYRYLALVFSYSLALLAKPSVVPLVAVLLVLDYWPYRRLADRSAFLRCLREKLPLLCLSAAALYLSLRGQQDLGTDLRLGYLSPEWRLLNALRFFGDYFSRALVPYRLAIQYPHPLQSAFALVSYISLASFAGAALLAWKLRRRMPWILCGLLWFSCAIALNLQLVQVGSQATADRHMYIPLAGILIALCFSLRLIATPIVIPILLLITTLSSMHTRHLVGDWMDSKKVFQAAVERFPNSTLARLYLGHSYARNKEFRAAADAYQKVLELDPDEIMAFQSQRSLVRQGVIPGSAFPILLFDEDAPQSLNFRQLIARSMMLGYSAQHEEKCRFGGSDCLSAAEAYLAEARSRAPDRLQLAQVFHLLGFLRYSAKDFSSALSHFERGHSLEPSRIDLLLLLADTALELRQIEKADTALATLGERVLQANEQRQLEFLTQKRISLGN